MSVIPQLERQLAGAARRRRGRNLRAAAIAVAAAIGAAAALLVPVLLDSGAANRITPAAPQADRVHPRLLDLLGVFRREPTPRDHAKLGTVGLIVRHAPQVGPSQSDSRRIDLPGGPVYLWRMKYGVCTSWGNCLPTEGLASLRVAPASGGNSAYPHHRRRFVVEGIAVDGIAQVLVGPRHGRAIVVPVRDNVFRVDLSDAPPSVTRVRWRENGRWHHHDLPALP